MTEIEKLRNIVFVGHGGAGKTSLSEVILYNSGATNRIGRVEDGNTIMDFEPEELKRQTSINSSFYQYTQGKHTICLIDTPGDQNFFSDTKICMQAADGAIFVIDAVDGVKVQTEQAWDFSEEFNLPCAMFINKLDRERSDFYRTVKDAENCFNVKLVPLQLPIGAESAFNGIVDLIGKKAFTYDDKGKASLCDIPDDMLELVESQRESLVENIAESDDDLLEKYLEGSTLSDDEIVSALKSGIMKRAFVPVLCGSATDNIGINLLTAFFCNSMPSPLDRGAFTCTDASGENEIECLPESDAPFAGFVIKTVADPYAGRLTIFRIVSGTLSGSGNFYNVTKDSKERYNQLLVITGKEQKQVDEAGPGAVVAVAKLKNTATGDTLCDESRKIRFKCADPLPTLISYAVKAKHQGEEDKIFISLNKILEEDTALKLERNSETGEILLSGSGQVHIEAVIEKLKRKYNVEVLLNKPKVPYKETIKKKVRVQGKHKKQSGGHGQYGDCWIQIEPLPKGKGFEFVDAVVGGSIPRNYIPAVEKGIIESSAKGILAGFPCVDFRVTLDDGTFHPVDSSEMAFKIAGSLAFKKAVKEAGAVLLEPIMMVSIITPDEFMGELMGDLNGRRGRVIGMDSKGKNQVIKAQVPLAEFLTYAPDLRSMTGGRGIFVMEFSHYEEVPAQIAEKIIENINKAKEAG